MRNIAVFLLLICLIVTPVWAIGTDNDSAPVGATSVAPTDSSDLAAPLVANYYPPAGNGGYSSSQGPQGPRGETKKLSPLSEGRSTNVETLKGLYEKAGKKFPVDFSHAKEALKNRKINSPSGDDYIAADRRLPVVLQKSVRVNRQNIQINREAIGMTYQIAKSNRLWLWILSIVTACLFLDRVLYWTTGRGLFSRIRGAHYGYR